MGYPYPRNATYTNPSRQPPFSSSDQTDNKYQARRSNIPGQNNNYSNVIQNHALQDRQGLVSGTLDSKPISILIDTGSSISLLDEQLDCLLSFVPLLQPKQFSVSGADDRPLIALGITLLPIAIDDNTFQVQLVVTRNILFPVVLKPYQVINTAPVAIPSKTDAIITIHCILHRFRNFLFELSKQHFADQPVESTL